MSAPTLRVVLITQDEPFYLADALSTLLALNHGKYEIRGCVLLSPSPFGRKESVIAKGVRTFKIFGSAFFLRYSFLYFLNKMRPSKRVASVLRSRGVPVIRLTRSINDASSLRMIRDHRPDVLVSIAGNEIFRKALIELAPRGCLNLHSALLPKYRGLFPSFWVLKNREAETGVSVFLVDEEIDNGPILVQKRLQIGDRSLEQLIRDTKTLGMHAVSEALDTLGASGQDWLPNDRAAMTYYGFPTRADVKEFLATGRKFY